MKPVLALDGEGVTDPDGSHRYTLLACDTGTLLQGDRLGTQEILDTLLALPVNTLKVIYGGSYDFNMWIGDFAEMHLQELYKCGKVNWQGYTIHMIQRKCFSVSKGNRRAVIWDVLGFFGQGFVKTIAEWGLRDDPWCRKTQTMKDYREDFIDLPQEDIIRYCLDECRALRDLVTDLRAVAASVGINPRRWDGGGAFASAMLRNHGVDRFHPSNPEMAEKMVNGGMFGGRFDTRLLGILKAGHVYDLNSAYPAAGIEMPCMRHGVWTTHKNPTSIERWGFYECAWEGGGDWGLFPVRDQQGNIWYPANGEGTVTGEELQVALDAGQNVQVLSGNVWIPACDHHPLDWLEDIYKQRVSFGKQDKRSKPLKFGINSVYGKCAERPHEDGRPPKWRCLPWAAWITGHTRAVILKTLLWYGEAVVAVATDGIITTQELPLPVSGRLGAWEHSEFKSGLIVTNGVYFLDEKVRTRGFGSKHAERTIFERAWKQGGIRGSVLVAEEKFITIGRACNGSFDDWRRWKRTPREITFWPARRDLDRIEGDQAILKPVQVAGNLKLQKPRKRNDRLSRIEKLQSIAPDEESWQDLEQERMELETAAAYRETIRRWRANGGKSDYELVESTPLGGSYPIYSEAAFKSIQADYQNFRKQARYINRR